jgi:hypothetical protein
VITVKQICAATIVLCGITSAQTTGGPSYPYLLRIEHSTFESHACALLQTSGAFHLEVTDGDNVKVFEGTIPTNDLLEIEGDLNSETLVDLSQQQIEEPLIRTRHDELQVTVLRGDDWQDLFFRSSDSQQPFERWLQPLVHWLDTLHKLPHRELSEDEGKNNCLPPKPISLKKRDADAAPAPVTSKTDAHILSTVPAPQPQPRPPQAASPQSVPALLRVYSFEMQTGSAHESCVLLGENGIYRFEDRTQKTGKPVNTKIAAGQIKPDELQQLHQLLDDPSLAKIKHHEPRGGVVPVMGSLTELSISRSAGVQHLVLSPRLNQAGFSPFDAGDADASVARPLLKFLAEHVENNPAGILDPSKRNGCSQAP